jgi:Tol biopolymer transport system component
VPAETQRHAAYTSGAHRFQRFADTADLTDASPAWSPDGSSIAFSRVVNGNRDIFVVDLSGRIARRLTIAAGTDDEPAWSLNGQSISFVSNRTGNREIYVMSRNGDLQTRLTQNTADDVSPSWSPDGANVVFATNRNDPPVCTPSPSGISIALPERGRPT